MLKIVAGGDFVDTELSNSHSPMRELPAIEQIPSMQPAHGGFPEPQSRNVANELLKRQRRIREEAIASEAMKRALEIRTAAVIARNDGFLRGKESARKKARFDTTFWFAAGVAVGMSLCIYMFNLGVLTAVHP